MDRVKVAFIARNMNIVGSGSSPVFGRQILDIGNEFDSPLSLINLFGGFLKEGCKLYTHS